MSINLFGLLLEPGWVLIELQSPWMGGISGNCKIMFAYAQALQILRWPTLSSSSGTVEGTN